MRILGVDPGLSFTGYGVVEGVSRNPVLVEAGVLKSPASQPLARRLKDLHEGLVEVIEKTQPEMMAIEALFSNYRHPTSAIQMGHARGVLLLAASQRGLPVYDYPPARVKKALTGGGRATKAQMQSMIQSIFSLEKPPEPPDVADAIAVALCHCDAIREGRAQPNSKRKSLPGSIQEAMEKAGVGKRGKSPLDNVIEGIFRDK
ncbi:MAG: crossover junction endodeoxyribonuclease RuvC [Candidatus Omnitrophica bacterium]|nr:crossover junction endodeoxyribonuclease RuvC [Candidatus Omnitrophota bacterium]